MNGKTKKIIQWTAGVTFSLLIIFVILISSFEIVLYSDMSVYRKEYEKYEVLYNDTNCISQNTANKKIVTLITCNNLDNLKRLIIKAK